MIDMASVYAKRFEKNPQMLQAAVMGQSPDPKLDPYTALNALRLIKESNMMAMAGRAQQPTSSPSLVAENMAPQMGLGAMVPNTMGQAPQGMPPQAPPMQAASGGLASMPTPEYEYAKGGIVAFQEGGLNTPAVTADPLADYAAGAEEGAPSSSALSRAQEALEKYMDFEPKEMTEKEQEAFLDRYMARVRKAGGPDIYAPAKERLAAREAAIGGDRKTGEGMALLTAAGKVLKGRSLAEGASEALPAYAQQMGEVRRAEQSEKRAIEQMNFALADAERKERMGDARGAQAALEAARKFQQDANRAQGDKLRYGADIAARTVGYSKTSTKGAGSGEEKLLKVNEQLAQAEIAFESDPSDANKNRVAALRRTVDRIRTSESGPGKLGAQEAALASKENIAAEQALTKHKLINRRDWKKAVEAAGGDEKAAADNFKKNWITANPQSAEEGGAPAPKPTTAGKVATMADVKATALASKKTEQEVIDALKAKGYTIK
jgi:hypothetical protein